MNTKFAAELLVALDKYWDLQDVFNFLVKFRVFRGYPNYLKCIKIMGKCPQHIRDKFYLWLTVYNVRKYPTLRESVERFHSYK